MLRQILDSPDDLAARRVWADKRAEGGSPEGEYIQLSCAVEELADDDPRRAELTAAALGLERKHDLTFARPIRGIAPFDTSPPQMGARAFDFSRGMVEVLCGPAEAVLPSLSAAASVAPIRALKLTEVEARHIAELAASPVLPQLRTLRLSGTGLEAALTSLFAQPRLALTRLELCTGATAELAAALVASPMAASLRELVLDRNGGNGSLGATGARALAGLHGLTSLSVVDHAIGAEGAVALAALPSLQRFGLDGDSLGARGGAAVAASLPASLRALSLRGCALGVKGAAAVVSARLPVLAELDLGGSNAIGGRKLHEVLEVLALPSLRQLSLDGAALKADGAAALRAVAGRLAGVELLDLSGNTLGDDGAAAIAEMVLPRLHTLLLGGNALAERGFGLLADGELLAQVRSLRLTHNKCQNAGGLALSRCRHLGGLTELLLDYNWMGKKGVEALLDACPRLEKLVLGENNYAMAPVLHLTQSGGFSSLREVSLREVSASAALVAFLHSPAGRGVEILRLSQCTIDEPAAAALVGHAALSRLQLSFCAVDDPAGRRLRRRFGANLSWWGARENWTQASGPP
jgi:hypothetical protein